MSKTCVTCKTSAEANFEPHSVEDKHVEVNTTFVIRTVRTRCKRCHTIYGKTLEKGIAQKLIAKTLCLLPDPKCNNTLRFCLTQAGITENNAETILGPNLAEKIPLTKIFTANLKNNEIKELPTLLWRKIAEKIAKETAHITFGITREKTS